MSKELLITETGSVSLMESKVAPRKGCLGTLKGPAADFKDPTRNTRFYSRKLWENVFATPWVQEAMETKTLFGEADHPADRLESRIQEAAIVMTSYSFNDVDHVLEAEFDILDTPNGRILKTMADYGCKIGISSRGRGNIVKKNGMDIVDENSFIFGGFDAVVLPAVKKARQTFVESLDSENSSVVNSLISQVSECKTLGELTCINNILEHSDILECSKDLADTMKNKFDELSESVNDSTTIVEGLENDLANAYETIQTLENKVLELDKVNTINESSESDYANEIASLIEEKESLSEKVSSLVEAINSKESKIALLQDRLSESSKTISKLNRKSDKSSIYEERVQALESKITKVNEKVSSLSEELTESNDRLNEKSAELNEQALELCKVRESLNNALIAYAKAKCSRYGLNPSRVVESIGNSVLTVEQLDKLVLDESSYRTRLNRIGISNHNVTTGTIVESSVPASKFSGKEDLSSTRAMLKSMNNYRGN